MNKPDLTLYYDGLCPLCSREIDYYRKKVAGDPGVSFVDITAPDFVAEQHGLDARRVHRVMHVRYDGKVYTGPDAFLAIWKRIPGHAWMARVGSWPVIYQLGWLAYHAFAWIRPLLPRRKRDCETGACQR